MIRREGTKGCHVGSLIYLGGDRVKVWQTKIPISRPNQLTAAPAPRLPCQLGDSQTLAVSDPTMGPIFPLSFKSLLFSRQFILYTFFFFFPGTFTSILTPTMNGHTKKKKKNTKTKDKKRSIRLHLRVYKGMKIPESLYVI